MAGYLYTTQDAIKYRDHNLHKIMYKYHNTSLSKTQRMNASVLSSGTTGEFQERTPQNLRDKIEKENARLCLGEFSWAWSPSLSGV